MNAETIIRAAENDGLRLALTEIGTVKCIGPKLVTERWVPQLRQHKAEILAVLTAANDRDLHAPERTLSDGEKSALAIAERAIARAALTDEQKASRLADLRRDPTIARFWALAWPEALNSSSKENR